MRQLCHAFMFALGLAALFGRPVLAATVAAPSLSALTARAERIVVSEVIEVRCEGDPARGDDVPMTLVTIRVSRTLKGAGSSHLVLEFLGGRVGDEILDVVDMPRFAVGDRDVLFLAGNSRRVSPLVGVMHGRFRLVESPEARGERVAAHDSRLLTQADLAADLLPLQRSASSGDLVPLQMFETSVLALVASEARTASANTGLKPRATPDTYTPIATTTEIEPLIPDSSTGRLRVMVNLGASPALFDGCPDWSCALESKDWFRRLSAGSGRPTMETAPPAEPVSLEWGQAVFGRVLDTDTLALAVRQIRAGIASTTVVFNQRLAWNAYSPGTRVPADGPLDLTDVAAGELSLVAAAVVSASTAVGSSASPAGVNGLARARRTPPSRAASFADQVEAAASACGPGDVFVDPRLLVFDSPDHALMSAYQVGFFQPGAASPAQVIDVPLTSFLIRRVVDLPSWAALAMQTSLVADIRTAGLATPLGVVYTYRVRGVWAGGTTAWSDSSQPFVRCAATASIR